MKTTRTFYLEVFIFLVVKYFNRRVFVTVYLATTLVSTASRKSFYALRFIQKKNPV